MESDIPRFEDVFRCTRCGDCCRGFGGTVVSAEEIREIAAFVGVRADRFVRDYCQPSGQRLVLAQGESGYCVFWDALCRIHPVKPRMCRAWPFLPAVLTDVGNWRAMGSVCPGIRTDVPDDAVIDRVRRELRIGGWFPAYRSTDA